MQQYWGQLCEQYNKQEMGHGVGAAQLCSGEKFGLTFAIGIDFVKNIDCSDEPGKQFAWFICHSKLRIAMDRQQVTVLKHQEDSAQLNNKVVGMAECSWQSNCLDISLASAETPYSKKMGTMAMAGS